MREISTEKKWKEVDNIIRNINTRRKSGKRPCITDLDHYIDQEFNHDKPREQYRTERTYQTDRDEWDG